MAKTTSNKKDILFEETPLEEQHIIEEQIDETIKNNMTDYGTYVIEKRAFVNACDGLKPSQRRLLYTFLNLNKIGTLTKLAKISGSCIGDFHPHGDSSINDAVANMLQQWKNNFPFFKGQGNWGSPAGDSVAAPRYVEVMLKKEMKDLLFENIKKPNVVPWDDNYSNDLQEPVLLPVKYPIHLLNGTEGIAYSISSKIPSYNIVEITKLFIYLIENSFWTEGFNLEEHKENIGNIVKGPDIPTHCDIYFEKEPNHYKSLFDSNFTFRMRSKYEINDKENKITFFNIPYNIKTETLKDNLFKLSQEEEEIKSKDGKKTTIRRKEPNEILNLKPNEPILVEIEEKDPSKIKVELIFKPNTNLKAELIKLLTKSDLEKPFTAFMKVINDKGVPVYMSFFENIVLFLKYRMYVTVNSKKEDIKIVNRQLHLYEALRIVFMDKNAYVKILTTSNDEEDFKKNMRAKRKFKALDDEQLKYLLDISTRRLLKIAEEKIEEDIKELEESREKHINVLENKGTVFNYIKEDYENILNNNKTVNESVRTSEILQNIKKMSIEDTITNDPILVYINNKEEISYHLQSKLRKRTRGNKDINNLDLAIEFKNHYLGSLKEQCFFLTNKGNIFKLDLWKLNQQTQNIRKIFTKLQHDEDIIDIIPCNEDTLNKNLLIITKNMTKNIELSNFENSSATRLKYTIKLNEGDIVQKYILHDAKVEENITFINTNGEILKMPKDLIPLSKGSASKGTKTFAKETILSNAFLSFAENEENHKILVISDISKAKIIDTLDVKIKKLRQAFDKCFDIGKRNGDIVNIIEYNPFTDDEIVFVYENNEVSTINSNDIKTVSKNAQGASKLVGVDNNNTLIFVDYSLKIR